jgi:uncharacterized membrane protein YhaH (DUF805 family)
VNRPKNFGLQVDHAQVVSLNKTKLRKTMIELFKKYSNFDRLAKRSEFWGVLLSMLGISFASGVVAVILSSILGSFGATVGLVGMTIIAVISIWIMIATYVARCKDAGINPWFTAAIIIPYIGTIVAIVIGCLKSKE